MLLLFNWHGLGCLMLLVFGLCGHADLCIFSLIALLDGMAFLLNLSKSFALGIGLKRGLPSLLHFETFFHGLVCAAENPQGNQADAPLFLHPLVCSMLAPVYAVSSVHLEFPFCAPEDAVSAQRDEPCIVEDLVHGAVLVDIHAWQILQQALALLGIAGSSQLAVVHDRIQSLQLWPMPRTLPLRLAIESHFARTVLGKGLGIESRPRKAEPTIRLLLGRAQQ
mmetsp:Transcript_76242/g.193477  ORF Transcript_76242/g.193477 Transcript_76242/m.193477 type:complete len:223 (-) Transcript_76242:788-1456(-)